MEKSLYPEFSAKDNTVDGILFDISLKYQIPRYQRPYAWRTEHINDFWEDISPDSESFMLGPFIFNYETQKKGYVEIIDGQQRLLTITILMAVLRDTAKEFEIDKLPHRIQTKAICFENKKGEQDFKIKCGDSTKEFFEKYIQDEKNGIVTSTPKNEEEEKIKKNYLLLKDKITGELKSLTKKEDQKKFIEELWERLGKLKVIEIKIGKEDDAYEIFERTNARGVELTLEDLLKNLIFKKIKPEKGEEDLAQKRWSEIDTNIKETGTDLSKFIRYFWLSKHSFVTEKKLFRAIKDTITDYQDFLEELRNASIDFNILLQRPEEPDKNIKDWEDIRQSLDGLKIMGVTQCYTFFMCILRNIKHINMTTKNTFNLIENFTFNYSAICKQPGNVVEKIYSKYARELENVIKEEKNPKKRDSKIGSIFSRIENDLKVERPNRETFIEEFMKLHYKNSDKALDLIRYLLSKINKMKGTNENEINDKEINIEHILPQNPDKEWGLTKAQIKDYVHNLGNLTLLSKKLNKKIGNKVLKHKITELEKSELNITKDLVKALKEKDLKWNKDEISDRQRELGELSYDKVWPL